MWWAQHGTHIVGPGLWVPVEQGREAATGTGLASLQDAGFNDVVCLKGLTVLTSVGSLHLAIAD